MIRNHKLKSLQFPCHAEIFSAPHKKRNQILKRVQDDNYGLWNLTPIELTRSTPFAIDQSNIFMRENK
jgi:hypothetical protein